MYFNPYFHPFFYSYPPHFFNFELTQPQQCNSVYFSLQEFNKNSNVKINISEKNNQSNTAQPVDSSPNRYSTSLRRKVSMKQTQQSKKNITQQNGKFYENKVKLKRQYQKRQNQDKQKKIKNNSISNILRLFLRRIKTKRESFQTLILKIINKHKMDLTVENFLQWLQQQEINHRIYLTLQTAKKYFYGKQSQFECYKVMRILFDKFVRSESLLCYLTSKKTKKEGLLSNLLTLRSIGKELFDPNGK